MFFSATSTPTPSTHPIAWHPPQENDGRVYLYMKTVERAHTPRNMWQRLRLPRSYPAALAALDEHLLHWPKFLVHKNKQRLTKITQYLIRMRKLALKARPKLVPLATRCGMWRVPLRWVLE
jgi:protein MAK16